MFKTEHSAGITRQDQTHGVIQSRDEASERAANLVAQFTVGPLKIDHVIVHDGFAAFKLLFS